MVRGDGRFRSRPGRRPPRPPGGPSPPRAAAGAAVMRDRRRGSPHSGLDSDPIGARAGPWHAPRAEIGPERRTANDSIPDSGMKRARRSAPPISPAARRRLRATVVSGRWASSRRRPRRPKSLDSTGRSQGGDRFRQPGTRARAPSPTGLAPAARGAPVGVSSRPGRERHHDCRLHTGGGARRPARHDVRGPAWVEARGVAAVGVACGGHSAVAELAGVTPAGSACRDGPRWRPVDWSALA